MAQSRPKTTTDPLKAIARRITDYGRRIRDLELRPDPSSGGFTPISASVHDGYNVDLDPVAEQSDMKFKVADIDVTGDEAQISLRSDGTIPPNFARKWLRYVWYDDGFSAENGYLTVPEDGVYAVHARTSISVAGGVMENCNLLISTFTGTNVYIAWTDGPRDVLNTDSDVQLNAEGQAFLAAGTQVRVSLSIDMSGMTGLPGTSTVITIPRVSRASAPPTDAADALTDARFSITKISDTTA